MANLLFSHPHFVKSLCKKRRPTSLTAATEDKIYFVVGRCFFTAKLAVQKSINLGNRRSLKIGGIGSLWSPFPLLLNLQAEKLIYEVVFNHTILRENISPSLCQREGTEGRECKYRITQKKRPKKLTVFCNGQFPAFLSLIFSAFCFFFRFSRYILSSEICIQSTTDIPFLQQAYPILAES